MRILVFNCGSSSLTYKVFQALATGKMESIVAGKAHRVGVTGTQPSFIEHSFNGETHKEITPIGSHRKAAELIFSFLKESSIAVDSIGSRFAHGGSHFQESVLLDDVTLKKLWLCAPLAPIHNPAALSVIETSRQLMPLVPQFVAFDSAFHATLPYSAYTYALPKAIIERFGFRKYGFHGLSYSWISTEAPRILGIPSERLGMVACHLGTGGSSVAAIRNGASIDTSMGYSPLTGLMMSTRCGDVDPIVALYLMWEYGCRSEEAMDLLNKRSGLLGISGFSSDVRDILSRTSQGGEERAELALEMYVHRVRKYVGSYVVALGGIDALVFTDDIGVHNPWLRERICEQMEWCGIQMDKDLNARATGDKPSELGTINSKVRILSLPTEEELVIAREGYKVLRNGKDNVAV